MADPTKPHPDLPTPDPSLDPEKGLPQPSPPTKLTHLSPTDLSSLRQTLGFPDPKASSSSSLLTTLWPARALPKNTLYHLIVTARLKSQYKYYLLATLYNVLLVAQLVFGASLTSLGAASTSPSPSSSSDSADKKAKAITVLAAANTVNAGMIALLHNSGLPHRVQKDWDVFAEVEIWVLGVLGGGVVEGAWGVDEVIAEVGRRFERARRVVQGNRPSSYVGVAGNGNGNGVVVGGS